MKILTPEFYNRSPLIVARELLGKVLIRNLNGHSISGRIVEVEAYLSANDEAAHSFRGRTKRNASLFKSAGHAYVHAIHTHNCLDIVTDEIDVPSSVLIRSLEPLEGIEQMKVLRKKESKLDLTSGPGKLTQALKITKDFDGIDVTDSRSLLFIIDDGFVTQKITIGKRIGISKARDAEYRFHFSGNPYISKK